MHYLCKINYLPSRIKELRINYYFINVYLYILNRIKMSICKGRSLWGVFQECPKIFVYLESQTRRIISHVRRQLANVPSRRENNLMTQLITRVNPTWGCQGSSIKWKRTQDFFQTVMFLRGEYAVQAHTSVNLEVGWKAYSLFANMSNLSWFQNNDFRKHRKNQKISKEIISAKNKQFPINL